MFTAPFLVSYTTNINNATVGLIAMQLALRNYKKRYQSRGGEALDGWRTRKMNYVGNSHAHSSDQRGAGLQWPRWPCFSSPPVSFAAFSRIQWLARSGTASGLPINTAWCCPDQMPYSGTLTKWNRRGLRMSLVFTGKCSSSAAARAAPSLGISHSCTSMHIHRGSVHVISDDTSHRRKRAQ